MLKFNYKLIESGKRQEMAVEIISKTGKCLIWKRIKRKNVKSTQE